MFIPEGNEDFEDHDHSGGPRPTPTSIDLINPFDSSTKVFEPEIKIEPPDDLAIPLEPQPSIKTPSIDPPTSIKQRHNLRGLPPGTIVGENYEIDAPLGAGAMGEIYAARHVRLGKRVAIKVIGRSLLGDDAAIGRLTLEARVLAQIQHPAIVAVEHIGELPDGRAYFVMEYLRGESLSERLARGRVPLREALRIIDQMARGLEAAHGSGIIHRDLKPDNTFLVHLTGEKPAVKLLDFGLAKLTADGSAIDQRAERSESGIVIGTPLYMSPEQARGPDVDHRTDIYALGCVAYELVLGVKPFPQAKTTPEIYAAHLHGSPSLPRTIWPEIPPQLDLVLFAMLAKDPAHRPTLSQVRSVIAGLRISTPSQQAATAFIEAQSPRRRLRRATIIMLAIAALATGATSGLAIGTAISSRSNISQPRHRNDPTPRSTKPLQTPGACSNNSPSTVPKPPTLNSKSLTTTATTPIGQN